MAIPPPKPRNLSTWNRDASTTVQTVSDSDVWEIGVPIKNSLCWSVALSYLISASDEEFPDFLTKLIGDDAERKELQTKKSLKQENVEADVIKMRLKNFNPFEKDHTFFKEAKEVADVIRMFDLRLKRYANTMKGKTGEWNDDLKVNAASQLLECKIQVYFPEKEKCVLYPKSSFSFKSNIIIFQYENQTHGARKERINIFCFAMTIEANPLKIDNTLVPIPKETKKENLKVDIVLIPPPKLKKIGAWNHGASTSVQTVSDSVWEIGVPAINSLYWSIVLAYLFSASDKDFPDFLTKLIGSDAERKELQTKKSLKLDKVEVDVIKKGLKSFNPFKNRHAFFNQAKELVNVFRIFKLRLNQYANSIKRETGEWNNVFKLNAASHFLGCKVEVYYPDNEKFVTYPNSSNFKSKIFLFQYENRQHGARKDNIDVFYFSMSTKEVHTLKINALVHILKKTKIDSLRLAKLKGLMSKVENHGNCFLPTIFQNEIYDIIPELYKSPYITVKLSEAGFETNPIASHPGKLSPFCYAAAFSRDTNCTRILYDYASTCHYLFDRSLRKVDDIAVEALKLIKKKLTEDLSKLPKCEFSKHCKNIAEHVLKQLILLTDYRLKIVFELNTLEIERETSKLTEFQHRKKITEVLLSKHLESFHKKYTDLSKLSVWFTDYMNRSEYYENADTSIYCAFFENFYKLRICINLKQENIFLNIEWRIFLAIITNRYFLNFDYEKKFIATSKECEMEYVLCYIPLLHRRNVLNAMNTFLVELRSAPNPQTLENSLITKNVYNDPDALPQLIDEILISRLTKMLDAALEVSPVDHGMRAVFAIERALQVIGESIKPPQSNRNSISYLLQSCLPTDLQDALVFIRNTLSHYFGYIVYGRLSAEDNLKYFDQLKEEIGKIKTCFEVVIFTQELRLEETVMFKFLQQFENILEDRVKKAFFEQYKYRVEKRTRKYGDFHDNCIQLVMDNIDNLENCTHNLKSEDIQNLQTSGNEKKFKDIFLGWLKTIEGLFRFILRHKPDENLNTLLKETENFIKSQENKKLDALKKDLPIFVNKCKSVLQKTLRKKKETLTAPGIKNFVEVLKTKIFSTEEEKEIIKEAIQNAFEEADEARKKLQDMLIKKAPRQNANEYLSRCLLSKIKVEKLREVLFSSDSTQKILTYQNEVLNMNSKYSEIEEKILEMLNSGSIDNGIPLTLLTKLTYQSQFSAKIYTSANLPTEILEKLEKFLTNKIRFLINRLEVLKAILIDEDEEIKETWCWGKSIGINHYMKFLMRERYMRDITVHASLDMAYFDCVNILKKESWKDLSEKSRDLFEGINLRNLVSHRTNIPEAIGGMLDKNDFPSEMIEKMLKLIEDLEAIQTLLKLFPVAGVLEKERFVNWINTVNDPKYKQDTKIITDCNQWEEYLSLLPFI